MSSANNPTRSATAAAHLVRSAARDAAARDFAAASASRDSAAAALAAARAAVDAARIELAEHATRSGAHDARSRFERESLEGVVRGAIEHAVRAERGAIEADAAWRAAQARLEQAEREVKVLERIDGRLDARDALARRRRLENSHD